MRAITLLNGEYDVKQLDMPVPRADEVLIKVTFAGVNRADLLQKQGRYPLPQQNPPVPGMEVSGLVAGCGEKAGNWKTGDRVCALLSEGAFSEYVCVPAPLVLPVPERVTLEEAACLPEACFTVWISFMWQARLKAGEVVLVHGGASGIGTIAIQIARLLGARVFATAGTKEKCAACEALGAEKAIHYPTEDYVAVVKEATQSRGADLILDMVGGDYFERNLSLLAEDGRLCIIAFLKGSKLNANLFPILLKRLSVMGSMLRPRPLEHKMCIAKELQGKVWPALAQGTLKPVIDHIFSLEEAEKALNRMDQGLNSGKILLKI